MWELPCLNIIILLQNILLWHHLSQIYIIKRNNQKEENETFCNSLNIFFSFNILCFFFLLQLYFLNKIIDVLLVLDVKVTRGV